MIGRTVFGKIYDNERSDSLATYLRKKRVALLQSLLESIPGSLKILDIGGTENFWQTVGLLERKVGIIEITLLNLTKEKVESPNMKSAIGDARNLKQFEDNAFDVVFSNSVIEHVGDWDEQAQMANEVRRVGKRYFIQTPNLYFPIEPHFVFPFFQFLPLWLRVWLVTHYDLGWYKKLPSKQKAIAEVSAIKLLSKKKLTNLFPDGKIYEEKFLGLTKSFVVYSGWDNS